MVKSAAETFLKNSKKYLIYTYISPKTSIGSIEKIRKNRNS